MLHLTMAPLVSVIVPSYNHSPYVEQCLKSILGQTYARVELIVIDDGSTDDSAAKIQKLQQAHGFHFERQDNMGLAKTLNKAANLAKGEFLAICASDDYWHPQKLELQIQASEANPNAALLYGYAVEVDDDGNEYRRQGTALSGNVFEQLVRSNPIPAPTAMVRRNVFIECGGFDPDCHIEDYMLWLKVARRYPIMGIKKVLAYYRVTMNSSSRRVIRMVEAEMQILKQFSNEPAMQRSRPLWVARGFERLAPDQKMAALNFLGANFDLKILLQSTFWKGLLKFLVPPFLKPAPVDMQNLI